MDECAPLPRRPQLLHQREAAPQRRAGGIAVDEGADGRRGAAAVLQPQVWRRKLN